MTLYFYSKNISFLEGSLKKKKVNLLLSFLFSEKEAKLTQFKKGGGGEAQNHYACV